MQGSAQKILLTRGIEGDVLDNAEGVDVECSDRLESAKMEN